MTFCALVLLWTFNLSAMGMYHVYNEGMRNRR